LFAAGVLTIGLTEYRPYLGGAGDLSDVLFLAAFGLSATLWLGRLDVHRARRVFVELRASEVLMWGGVVITAGGVVSSLGSHAASVSWLNTAKYFATFCVWLPWVAFGARA
jgi:hypothetical protein